MDKVTEQGYELLNSWYKDSRQHMWGGKLFLCKKLSVALGCSVAEATRIHGCWAQDKA